MPSAHSEAMISTAPSSTAIVTRSSGNSVSSRAPGPDSPWEPAEPICRRRWSIEVLMAIQIMLVSSTSAATPNTRRPNRTSGFSLVASSATGVSSAIAQAPMPSTTTRNRAAERTMLGKRLLFSLSSFQKKKIHSRRPICSAITIAAMVAINAVATEPSTQTAYTAMIVNAAMNDRESRGGIRLGPSAAARCGRPMKANAMAMSSRAVRVATARRNALAACGVPAIRSSSSGTNRPSATSSTTVIAAAASHRVFRGSTGTSFNFACPGASTRCTAIQARRSTSRRSVAATTSCWTPGGQVNAAEAPIAATVNSSSPEPRNTRRRRPSRRACRGEDTGIDWITRYGA